MSQEEIFVMEEGEEEKIVFENMDTSQLTLEEQMEGTNTQKYYITQ